MHISTTGVRIIRADNQEDHHLPTAISRYLHLAHATSFTRKQTSINGPSFKARSSNDWCRKTSPISRKKWPERRSIQPPPAAFLAPPAFLETVQDKEERQRQQNLLDEARKKKEDKYEEYRDNFAKDFPKGISAHYAFLSQSIITDLERTIENIIPPTTNIMTQYRVMKERLLGPNSQKDAEDREPSSRWPSRMGHLPSSIQSETRPKMCFTGWLSWMTPAAKAYLRNLARNKLILNISSIMP